MKLVVTKKDTVHVDACRVENIYVCWNYGQILKLHGLENGFAFLPLNNTKKESYFYYPSLKKSIEKASEYGDVYEFKDIKEFLEWGLSYETSN